MKRKKETLDDTFWGTTYIIFHVVKIRTKKQKTQKLQKKPRFTKNGQKIGKMIWK